MKKFFSVVLLAIFFIFLPIKNVFAVSNFSTTLTNTQTVDENGNTHVTKVFTLKNNLSTVYVTKYGLEITSTKLKNIHIRDITNNTTLQANIVKTENSTTIGIEFPDIIVGKDKTRKFSIEYDDPDAAIVSGNVLEVYVPKVADPANFDHYSSVLKIPKKFGQPTIATPSTYSLTNENEENVLTFDKESSKDGISIIFGEKQYFDFSLNYNLQNPTGTRGIMQITLPPDTSYQKVKYSEINPRPEKIEIDADGNWIATYLLEANQSQTVNAKGIASIYLQPVLDTPVAMPRVQHIQADTYWETKDPIIENIASKYKTPREIFDFDVDTLKYNYERLSNNSNRQGAKAALANSSDAVCQEFTDVFVTLARANSIPARQATGYAFTNNSEIRPLSLVKDVLHAWPEYFDETTQKWIPVDPTWTNTTGGIDYFTHLDFSHFVFSYQGLSSEKPYPAGSYKYEGQEGKDVFVDVTDHDLDVIQDIDVQVKKPFSSFFNLLGSHELVITNKTGTAWYHIPISYTVPKEVTLNMNAKEIEGLLPYQSIEIPFEVIGTEWFKAQPSEVTMTVGDDVTYHEITASSKLQELKINPQYVAYFAGSTLFTAIFILMLFSIYHRIKDRKKN